MNTGINIILDGAPSQESGRFVEVENDDGQSVNIGEWTQRDNGYWGLRIEMDSERLRNENAQLKAQVSKLRGRVVHAAWCDAVGLMPCTCGLDELLKESK